MVNWVTDFFSFPLVLFVLRIIMGTGLFLTMYATVSKIFERTEIFKKPTTQLLSFIISFYAFMIPFPPSADIFGIVPFWNILGLLHLCLILFFVTLSKFLITLGLMIPRLHMTNKTHFLNRSTITILLGIGVILQDFFVEIFRFINNQIDGVFAYIFVIIWVIGLLLAIKGAYKCVFGFRLHSKEEALGFLPIMQQLLGDSSLLKASAYITVVLIVLVIPQTIPFGNIIPKIGTILGVIIAFKWLFV